MSKLFSFLPDLLSSLLEVLLYYVDNLLKTSVALAG